MLNTRVIPVLLLKDGGLYKGESFKNHRYVGDPINAVKIFNEKEVDEIIFFDISATSSKNGPDYDLIRDIASEAFMPFGYGGGIHTFEQARKVFELGVEKVVLCTAAFEKPELIKEISQVYGSQSVVVSMDVKKTFFGSVEVFVRNGTSRTKVKPLDFALKMQELGAGELIYTSIDREGRGQGYDLDLVEQISSKLQIPVVASGGASALSHFREAVDRGASAVAAGNMFVFHGKHKAVLITYPKYADLKKLFAD